MDSNESILLTIPVRIAGNSGI